MIYGWTVVSKTYINLFGMLVVNKTVLLNNSFTSEEEEMAESGIR